MLVTLLYITSWYLHAKSADYLAPGVYDSVAMRVLLIFITDDGLFAIP